MQVPVKVKSARYLRPGAIDAYKSSDMNAAKQSRFSGRAESTLNC